MRTFSIHTLGCKVNQYESEQIATLLLGRGLARVEAGGDLRIVNTCSVTTEAAAKSRQSVRRSIRLPMLAGSSKTRSCDSSLTVSEIADHAHSARTIVTGCWATSDCDAAERIPGVDAVLGHHDDVAGELARLLDLWEEKSTTLRTATQSNTDAASPEPSRNEGWMKKAGVPASDRSHFIMPDESRSSKENRAATRRLRRTGTTSLPLLGQRQTGHQRAFLKIQDGCDAHCTYCIIPKLRPILWSKPPEDAADEARRLVAAGHVEIVLTGIFLGAYGQSTALRRRQSIEAANPLAELISELCTGVKGLKRLRLSSLEPGDLTAHLLAVMKDHEQIVPHFHLPLQSGSDSLLHRMNRQYTREDYLRMVDRVNEAFDRPALTTDIITGFPGESDDEFQRTLEVVDRAGFIHTHAFPYSPRPNTAAARWTRDFVPASVASERIRILQARAREHSHAYRQSFLNETVELLVEHDSHSPSPGIAGETPASSVKLDRGEGSLRHGRCERYFPVHFEGAHSPGQSVHVRITRVTPSRTFGSVDLTPDPSPPALYP